MKKLMIIDGSSLLFRAFFALPPLKSALGTPTNAVYGFLTMLIKLYEEIKPDYIAVAFDKGRQTFRTDMYSEYKGNRPDAPEDLRPQFSLIQDVLKALGICVIEEEGYEGDDILGSLSKKFGSSDLAVQIITGDRDNLQLVTDYSHVFLTKKGISDMLEVTLDNMKYTFGGCFINYASSLNKCLFCFFYCACLNSFNGFTSCCTDLRFHSGVFRTTFSIRFYASNTRFNVWQLSHLLKNRFLYLNDYIIQDIVTQGLYYTIRLFHNIF